ncbi:phosphotransferase enzyme family protein [Hirsutella rhossiliensis]|uniref:Phosphotransferase enzyme family domain-containing protein n=1 Tax=Hirsutella rhossiliensis TaxID=111463 RepID=A0A9P8SJJ7_9HYPO|nr:phosphotransferase enzyme family domain-containing protein [Hirsutella rhossiliensis]KAH0964981.1 phosphotransferase enzyme family domain-containing protein [Hirsutella rhossiliensis]
MSPVTNQMLNARREKECVGLTTERKYFHVDGAWIKRSLRPSEWQTNPFAGMLFIPRFGCFEDDGAVYLVMEYIDGVTMNNLALEQRKVVETELERYVETLSGLRSDAWGGPSGIVIPPYRIMTNSARSQWKMKSRETKDLVFCHNDLSTHNVIVDPATLKVKAILDWEYAGFFPKEFEGMFFRRPGPSAALEGEVNDERELLEVMYENEAK